MPGPSGPVGGGGDLTLPMVLIGWMVLALLLFLLRPSSLRGPRPTGKPPGPHNVSIDHTHSNNILSIGTVLLWLCILGQFTTKLVYLKPVLHGSE